MKDLVDQRRFLKRALKQAKVVVVELDPEGAALQVFEPALAEKPVPMFADPAPDGRFAEVSAGLFALDPLVALCFDRTPVVDTQAGAWPDCW
jgi:hypothetical protein